jgi:arylsulfatase
MFNLRRDPFERADENSNTYWDWVISHAYLLYEMQGLVAHQILAFVQFPPRQKPAAFQPRRSAPPPPGGVRQR